MINISKPFFSEEEYESALNVLKSGNLAQGEKVLEFEDNFRKFIGSKEAIAVSNGTSALHTSLLSHGIKKDDEVITTSFTFAATPNTILHTGATPVFVDINEDDFNIDPDKIEEKITKKTKAILPVHLFGCPCNIDKIEKIAKKHNLEIIEDCAQAIGTSFNNIISGSRFTGCFSFYPTKNITTIEGGMITTNNDMINEKCRMIRNHGSKEKYKYEILGHNFRMDDLRASIGIVQLKKISIFNKKRKDNALYLEENLNINGIIKPEIKKGHTFNQYTIRITEDFKRTRDKTAEILKENGIMTGIYYPVPMHKTILYTKLGYSNQVLQVSEKISKEVLSLPIHPEINQENLDHIINTLKNIK